MVGQNKHENILYRKRYRRNPPYRCCSAPFGNCNKMSTGLCCTFPQCYKRHDESVAAKIEASGRCHLFQRDSGVDLS